MAVAREHDLAVIEDAAHAHGASYRGRPAGSLGHMASFSFQSSKNLTAGEGGIITTNDDRLAAACRSIHNCGRVEGGVWYEHHVISGNYRLGEFQGAVLNAQLDRLEEQTETRDRNGPRSRGAARRRCPASIRRSVPPNARATAITSSCCGSTRRRSARRATRCVDALAAEGIPCSAGYGYPAARAAAVPQQGVRPVPAQASRDRLDYRRSHAARTAI